MKDDWLQQLTRAICAATANGFVLERGSFFTLAEIRGSFGVKEVDSFKEWFEAKRHCDQRKADRLLHRLKKGDITEAQYRERLFSVFTWVWSVKQEKQLAAFEITRRERDI